MLRLKAPTVEGEDSEAHNRRHARQLHADSMLRTIWEGGPVSCLAAPGYCHNLPGRSAGFRELPCPR